MTANRIGLFCAGLCVALWAFIPVVSKMGQTELDQFQFLFWSSLVSFATLLLLTLQQKKTKHFREFGWRGLLHASILGLLGTFIYYWFLYQGYREADGMSVLVMQYTWPLMIAILSVFLLGERLSKHVIIALCIGMFGVILVLTKGHISQLKNGLDASLLWVAAGAFCFALFSVLSKKVHYEPLSLNSLYFGVATIAAAVLLYQKSQWVLPHGEQWLGIIANGVFINGVSYVFWIAALRRLPASEVAVFIFSTPVLSTLYLYLFYAEEFLPIYVYAIGCVVFAGILASLGKKRRNN